ncbi:hypothetical protein [Celerinatantimonas diazotrophica]|uniref:hypothetical protein n=1 Tax=Celerinatantimonas diazotrophica TaxID=412034 RepID=UPI001CC5AD36|nr:hypothetical protein [Celerinatantimonas diazotrophica]
MEDEYYRQRLFNLNEQLNQLAQTNLPQTYNELLDLSSQISLTAMQVTSHLSKQKKICVRNNNDMWIV